MIDSKSLAGQVACRWQSRLSEGLGVCALLESQKEACSVLASDHLPGQAREGAFERPQEIEADVGASLLSLHIRSHRAQAAKLRDCGDAGHSQRCLGLGAEVGQLGDRLPRAHLSCFGCRTKTVPSAPSETVRSLTVVYEATPSG